MDNQYQFNEIPEEIPRPVLRYAIESTPGFRGIAEAVKDKDYYHEVYNRRRGSVYKTVKKSLIQPLLNHSPEFSAAIKDGLALYVKDIEESVSGSSAAMMADLEKAMLIIDGVYEQLDNLRRRNLLADAGKLPKPKT